MGALRALPAWLRPGVGRAGFPVSVAALAVATCAAVNVPLLYIFVRSLEGGWAQYWQAVASPLTLRLLTRTLALLAGVVIGTAALALPMAWLVSRSDLPARRAWAIAGALPLVFPSYVAALALVSALGPRGYVRDWLAPLGVTALPDLAYGYSGAFLTLTLFTYPYLFLLLVAALRQMDPALEETSRALGVGRARTFVRVVLPQLRPALYGGGLLVSLYVLSDFGAVSIVRFNTFTLSIYNAYRGLFDRSAAASLASVLVLVTLAIIALEAWLSRGVRPHQVRPARPAPRVPLGRWRWPAIAFLSIVALLNLGLPLGVVGFWGLRAFLVGNPLGAVGLATVNSLGVSAAAALVAVGLAVPLALWSVRSPGLASRSVERLSHAGYALPGIVIALALVFLVSRYLLPLYQTLGLLVAAYTIRFLPQALAATRSALAAVGPRFEEAARSLGRSRLEAWRTLTLPMIGPGLAGGAGLVFLTAMKELPATLILRPTGFETLATRIWSSASEGIYSQAAAPALWLVAASLVPVYLLVIRPVLEERGT